MLKHLQKLFSFTRPFSRLNKQASSSVFGLAKTLLIAALCLPWVTQAQTPGDLISTLPYSCDFESSSVYGSWVTLNGTQENGWYIGAATNATQNGSQALYVSKNSGTSNSYDVTTDLASYTWAYQRFAFNAGSYNLSFKWKCMGELSGDPYDFFRVFIVPDTVTLTAGVLPSSSYTWSNQFMSDIPTGWIGVNNGAVTYFCDQSTFTTINTEFAITETGNYKLVFVWLNDDNSCYDPPAAIDDIEISVVSCVQPSNLAVNVTGSDATFTWTDATGSSWEVAYGAVGFDPDNVSASSSSTTSLTETGISDGFYEAYVRTNCGTNGYSNWYGPVQFNVGVIVMNMSVTGTDTIHSCNAIIYDDGGPNAAYSANCNSTLIIYPSDEYHALSISGTSYTEGTYDYLRIYEGVGTTGTQLWNDYGVSATQSFGPFISANPITITFYSDGSIFYDGFQINVSCVGLPDCARPESFTSTGVTTTSADFTWVDNAGTNWVIEYGPAGFTQGGSDALYASFTETYGTINNLTPNTAYDFYLMSVCNNSDTSWSRFISLRTPCAFLDTLPYTQDFEGVSTGSSTNNMFVNCLTRLNNGTQYFGYPYVGGSTYNHTSGGNRGLYWYNTTTTGTYGDYQYVVMPGIDTNFYPINTLQLKFWSRASGSSYSPVFQVGVMTDPNNVNTFQLVSTINVGNSSVYAEYITPLGNYSGEGCYIAIRALRNTASWYAYVDDITIETMPSCPPIANINVDGVTAGAAIVSWDYLHGMPGTPVSYEIMFDSVNSTATPTTLTTTDNYYFFTGLEEGTDYRAYIRAACSDGEGPWDSIDFTTAVLACVELDPAIADTVVLAGGTNTTYYIPLNNYYNYSYTQQLVTATEMGNAAATLTGIDFDYAYTSPSTDKGNVSIYLANTSATSLSSSFVPYSSAFVLVYTGPMNCTQGWNHFEFSNPFSYDGTSNLLIVIHDNSGDYNGSAYVFNSHSASGKARYINNDSSPYSLTSPGTGTSYSYRNNMRLYAGECQTMATCAAPVATIVGVDTTEIEVAWIPGYQESSWDLDYRTSGNGAWTNAASSLTNNSYTISGLTPGTNYDIRVSHLCDTTTYSSTITVATHCVPLPIPFTTSFETSEGFTSGTTGILPNTCWNKYTNYSTSYYPYVYTTYAHTGSNSMYMYTYTYNSYCYFTLPLLDVSFDSLLVSFWLYKTSNSYPDAKVQVGVMTDPTDYNTFTMVDEFSPVYGEGWTMFEADMRSYTGAYGNIAFVCPMQGSTASYPYMALDDITVDYFPSCPHVTNIHTTMVDADSMRIAWTPGGTESEWIVTSETDTVVVTESQILITGLAPNLRYNFTVTAVCDQDDSSMTMPFSAYAACGKLTTLPLVMDFEGLTPTSTTVGVSIPCWSYLNNGSSHYPYISASSTYNHTENGINGLYWYNYYTQSTYGDYQIIVMPEVDTTVLPVNNLMFSFWAKPSSTSYEPVFYVGVMSNPNDASSFIYYDTIAIDHSTTNWHKYTVMFDNFTDTGSFIAIRANRVDNVYWYAYVDDLTLDVIPACSPVEDVAVEAGPVSAMVSWNVVGNSYQGALVEYKEATASTWNSVTVTGVNYSSITGLTPATNYDLRVSAVCSDVSSNAVVTQFTSSTFGCAEFDSSALINVTIGQGASTSSYFPSYSTYNYGYSQQFYTAHEIGGAGVITSITLTPSSISQQRTYEIFMGTYADSLSATYINPTGLTCVYNGGHIPLVANQPVTFNLTTPFNYNGTSNLVVIFRDVTGSWVSGNAWYGDNAWPNASQMNYQDANAYTVPQSGTGEGSHASENSFRNKITFFGGTCLQASTCAAPPAAVVNVTPFTVDVAWTPGNTETAWNLYYRPMSSSTFTTAALGVTTTTYQFTGLTGGTNYEFMITAVCADSMSTILHATTECALISSLPYTENFNSWGAGSGVMPNCWYRTGSYSSYTYISASQNHSGTSGGSIYMYQSGTYHSTIFFPALDTNIYQANQTQLVFYAKNTSDSYLHPGFEIGVLSDPSDIASFVPVDTVYHTESANIWQIFEVPLANYTGSGAYIGLRTVDNPNSSTEYTYTYPYLDDFTLELIPTCPRPDSLTAINATTTSVDLTWHERGSATNWIIEYGPLGFTLGTGTVVAANSNPFTLNGLPVAYQGEYYVKSVCGAGDTGEYSRIPCAFGTSQTPATIPYTYNFEDASEWSNWQTCSNVATNWYRGTAVANSSQYSMYVSADAGATYKPYSNNAVVNTAVFRDVDFGNVDSSFTITFDARVGGTISASYDGLMVFLVDPSLATVASNSNITSPWGNVNDLYRIATVRLDTVWHTHSASFDNIHGIQRVAFFWFNQSTSSYEALLEPAAVDNINIDYSPCPRPVAVTANAIGSTTANLTWNGPASGSYQVIYRQYPGSYPNTFVNTNTNSIILTGLEPVTQYAVWVRKLCGSDTSLTSDGITFTTELCDGAEWYSNFDTVNTTGTSSYSPIGYSFYNYSYVQTIIDSAQLAGLEGDIVAFVFDAANTTSSTYYTNMDVYMANVPESDLSSGFIHPDSAHVFVPVILNGNFNFDAVGQHMFGFDSVFTWDGHSNVLFAVNRRHGSYSSSGSFNAHNYSSSKMCYVYNDGSAYDPATVSGGTTSNIAGDIYLLSCGGTACQMPGALNANNVSYNAATINWTGTVTDFEVSVKAANEPTWPAETAVAGTSYNVNNLAPATAYMFRVRALCDTAEGLISDWAVGNFVTDSLPCFAPSNFESTAVTVNSVTLDWTVNGEETMWNVHVWNTAFDSNYVVNAHPATVGGLAQNVAYYAAVSALCGNGAVESDFSDTIQFTTAICQPVTNATATSVTAHTAVITWNGNATSYDLEYGRGDFGIGTGTQVNGITATTYTLTDLVDEAAYTVYIRANCEGQPSAWSQVQFTTAVGIDGVNGVNVTIYPNPTTTSTTIALSGITGEVSIAIVDMNGRTVRTDAMSCEGDCVKTIEVSGLAQGAYFVRVNGEGVNMVKKLVVK